MTLTIDIAPELETRLRQEAAKAGLETTDYVLKTLEGRLCPSQPHSAAHLSETEASLLQAINQGLPGETWERYRELLAKRRAEALAPNEQVELIAISDQIEELNAHRIQRLTELAALRRMALPDIMEQLGLNVSSQV